MSLLVRNFLLFQIGWFACVLGGASKDYSWAGIVVVSLIVIIHLNSAGNRKNEALLLVIATLIGTTWDSILMQYNLYSFSYGMFVNNVVPHWLIAMWCLFATTLNVSMKWMKGKYFLASMFGALGGPLAYYAGHRLGAVQFEDPLTTLVIVAIGWSVIMPALVAVSDLFNGYSNRFNNRREAEVL